jgi:rubrerythrin
MPMTFNADEVFEMAEQMERNGAAFYRAAAQTAQDSASRERLLGFAVMEEEHERTFASIKAKLAGAGPSVSTFDPDGEAALYLQAMVAGKVFDWKSDATTLLAGTDSLADIYWIAIGLEKDSIAFYTGVKEMIPEHQGKDKIDFIIREEMGHINTLTGALDALE